MKKVLAFLLAVLIALGVMINNGIKAHAVIAAPAMLTFIIEACEALLVGSGIVVQEQFDTMSTSDVFEKTSNTISYNPDLILPDPIFEVSKQLSLFINSCPESSIAAKILKDIIVTKGGGSSNNNKPDSVGGTLLSFGFLEWVKNHIDSLEEVTVGEGFDMHGYGCVKYLDCTDSLGNRVICIGYGDYGIINSPNNLNYYLSNPVKINPGGTYWRFVSVNGSIVYDDFFSDPTSSYYPSYLSSFNGNYLYFGDWRYSDGTSADDKTTSSEAETKPADIGEVEVDGQTYPISGDGTVTIGDEAVPINEDGSVTINNNTYYPTYDLTPYDDTAIIDLLNQILQQIQVTEDGNPAKEIIDNAVVDVPIEIANSDLASLEMPKSIATVFPFCIPWDFYNGVKLLAQKPKAPRFEVPFEIPAFGLFPGFKKIIVLDFAEYESAFVVVRWVTFTLFIFGLCFLTFKIVKGV